MRVVRGRTETTRGKRSRSLRRSNIRSSKRIQRSTTNEYYSHTAQPTMDNLIAFLYQILIKDSRMCNTPYSFEYRTLIEPLLFCFNPGRKTVFELATSNDVGTPLLHVCCGYTAFLPVSIGFLPRGPKYHQSPFFAQSIAK